MCPNAEIELQSLKILTVIITLTAMHNVQQKIFSNKVETNCLDDQQYMNKIGHSLKKKPNKLV